MLFGTSFRLESCACLASVACAPLHPILSAPFLLFLDPPSSLIVHVRSLADTWIARLSQRSCFLSSLPQKDQIKAAPAVLNHTYTILFTPRITSVCTNMLEELGVLGSIELLELPMSLIPLEKDVLSMELGPQNYKDIFLDSNYDSISEMARSLTTLQRAFGLIPRILGKGDAARVGGIRMGGTPPTRRDAVANVPMCIMNSASSTSCTACEKKRLLQPCPVALRRRHTTPRTDRSIR